MAGLKQLILTVSTLGRCGSLKKTEFNSFYFEKSVAVLKEPILTVSTLGRCGGVDRTDFTSIYLWRV